MKAKLRMLFENLVSGAQDFGHYSLSPWAYNRDSAILGFVGRRIFEMLPPRLKNKNTVRRALDTLQPIDPLSKITFRGPLPPIDIIIATAEKDFELMDLTIDAAIKSSANPVASVKIVVPVSTM